MYNNVRQKEQQRRPYLIDRITQIGQNRPPRVLELDQAPEQGKRLVQTRNTFSGREVDHG